MYIKDWKRELFSIPNLLSFFRLVLIPVYAYIYLNATQTYQYFIAGSIMAVSCLTDMIDGKIARHFNMITTLGKILDPVADKVTQFTLTLCLSLKYPVLLPVLSLFVGHHIVHVIEDGSGTVKYEVCGSERCTVSDMHTHFYCEKCHRTYCFKAIQIPEIELPEGFSMSSVNYVVKGVCPECAARE